WLLNGQYGAERWRMVFSKPLIGREKFVLENRFVPRETARWRTPWLRPVGPPQGDTTVSLQPVGLTFDQVHAVGMQTTSTGGNYSQYRWDGGSNASLEVRTQTLPAHQNVPSQPDQAQRITYVSPDGPAYHAFSFVVGSWPEAELPVHIPLADAQVLG